MDILFFEDWGTLSDREKKVRAEKQTYSKLDPWMVLLLGFEPMAHWKCVVTMVPG